MHNRTVFFVSDGTGITAETFGNAILAQFNIDARRVRLPYVDTVDKAHQVVRQINNTAQVEGTRPIVFSTLVNAEVLDVIKSSCKGKLLDMFGTFVEPLEAELGVKSNHESAVFLMLRNQRPTMIAWRPLISPWRMMTVRATGIWPGTM